MSINNGLVNRHSLVKVQTACIPSCNHVLIPSLFKKLAMTCASCHLCLLADASDTTDSDNCLVCSPLDWSVLISCVFLCVCACTCVCSQNHTAEHWQTSRCRLLNSTLGGCALSAGHAGLSFPTRCESSSSGPLKSQHGPTGGSGSYLSLAGTVSCPPLPTF